jgi:DNA-binding TFAR19-related protein (PDSD5 family)
MKYLITCFLSILVYLPPQARAQGGGSNFAEQAANVAISSAEGLKTFANNLKDRSGRTLKNLGSNLTGAKRKQLQRIKMSSKHIARKANRSLKQLFRLAAQAGRVAVSSPEQLLALFSKISRQTGKIARLNLKILGLEERYNQIASLQVLLT